MKNNKHSIADDDTKDSSTALALQQLRKEEEKKEKAAESARVLCKVCNREISPKRLCAGHGSGGGGSEVPSEENTNETSDRLVTEAHLDNIEKLTDEHSSMGANNELDSELDFDPEIIAELIAKGLLVVTNDRQSSVLTISLQCEPRALSEEQRKELDKFLQAIIREFNTFKEQYHLSADCINIIQNSEGSILSLRISLPTLTLYDSFIQQLSNNLLPTVPQLLSNKENQKTPTSLPIAPIPANKGEENIETDNPGQETPTPSPFSTKMKPW